MEWAVRNPPQFNNNKTIMTEMQQWTTMAWTNWKRNQCRRHLKNAKEYARSKFSHTILKYQCATLNNYKPKTNSDVWFFRKSDSFKKNIFFSVSVKFSHKPFVTFLILWCNIWFSPSQGAQNTVYFHFFLWTTEEEFYKTTITNPKRKHKLLKNFSTGKFV